MINIFIFVLFLKFGFSDFVPEDHPNWNLLPHATCGQVSTNRIIGGKEARMNAYPWMARIGYVSLFVTKPMFLCGGVLINDNRVLTAAHCTVTGELELSIVRLGEHNEETDPDCDDSGCADPVIDIPPSRILVHPSYNRKTHKNDLALIFLKEKVKFSAFVKPICLGGKDFVEKNFVGNMAEVAGWGIHNIITEEVSKKLEFVRLPIVDINDCIKKYNERNFIDKMQICAGGQIGKDSCSGDSGGPLMIVDDGPVGPRYYLLGIVSFGPTDCGAKEIPGVYSRVSFFLKWILDHL